MSINKPLERAVLSAGAVTIAALLTACGASHNGTTGVGKVKSDQFGLANGISLNKAGCNPYEDVDKIVVKANKAGTQFGCYEPGQFGKGKWHRYNDGAAPFPSGGNPCEPDEKWTRTGSQQYCMDTDDDHDSHGRRHGSHPSVKPSKTARPSFPTVNRSTPSVRTPAAPAKPFKPAPAKPRR